MSCQESSAKTCSSLPPRGKRLFVIESDNYENGYVSICCPDDPKALNRELQRMGIPFSKGLTEKHEELSKMMEEVSRNSSREDDHCVFIVCYPVPLRDFDDSNTSHNPTAALITVDFSPLQSNTQAIEHGWIDVIVNREGLNRTQTQPTIIYFNPQRPGGTRLQNPVSFPHTIV